MKIVILMTITLIVTGLLAALPSVDAEIVGAHVSKVITDYTEPGYASAAVLICAGNNPLSYPEIVVSSDQETKSVVMIGDVPVHTCRGEMVTIKTNDLSSITASLNTAFGPIAIDEVTRDVSGEIMLQGMSADGKIIVQASSSIPESGTSSIIKIEFIDVLQNSVQHVNYDITVKQAGVTVLDEPSAHTHTGISYHETQQLNSDSPLDIKIKLLGLGLPGESVKWEGPKGDVIQFMAVPEFGTIASLVLVATISAVVLGAKSRIQLTR